MPSMITAKKTAAKTFLQGHRVSQPAAGPTQGMTCFYRGLQAASYQLHQHDDQKRRGHKSADEDALVIKVRLSCKRLPVLLQVGVDPLSIVNYSSCMQVTKLLSTPHM